MFGMGMGEILLIAVVALIFVGPDRLPDAARAIGKGIRDLRQQTKGLQKSIEDDTEIGEAVRELRGALRGDPEYLYRRHLEPQESGGEEADDDLHTGDADGTALETPDASTDAIESAEVTDFVLKTPEGTASRGPSAPSTTIDSTSDHD